MGLVYTTPDLKKETDYYILSAALVKLHQLIAEMSRVIP